MSKLFESQIEWFRRASGIDGAVPMAGGHLREAEAANKAEPPEAVHYHPSGLIFHHNARAKHSRANGEKAAYHIDHGVSGQGPHILLAHPIKSIRPNGAKVYGNQERVGVYSGSEGIKAARDAAGQHHDKLSDPPKSSS